MKKLFTCMLMLLPISSLASMFCPGSFNSINIGDSLEKVQQECGAPSTSKKTQSAPNEPQEWLYFIKYKPDAGSLKMTVAFVNDKLVNLTLNGTSLTTTTICNQYPIKIDDTAKIVEAACGKPAFISQNNSSDKSSNSINAKPTEITELTYGIRPAVILVFENGKLTERR